MVYKCTLIKDPRDTLEGIKVLTTLNELYQALPYRDMVELHLLPDFLHKFFNSFSLNSFLRELRIMHPNVIVKVDEQIEKRKDKLIERLKQVSTVQEFLNVITANSAETLPMLSEVLAVYQEKQDNELRYSQTISSMYTEFSRMNNENNNLQRKYRGMELAYQDLLSAYDTLSSRIRLTYNIDTETTDLFHLDIPGHSFQKVLYIKEVTRVTYTDTLVYYLKQIINSLYKTPTRNLIIEAPYAYSRASMYPGYKVHTDLTFQDVASADIFMAGFQHDLTRDIFLNPMNSLFLVILDRSGWKEPFISCENMEVLYTVSDLKDLPTTVPKNRVISYDKETLHIPYIKDFDSLNSEQKLTRYSHIGTMRRLLDILELD